MVRARIRVDGRLEGDLQAFLGAPMAAYSGCGERDGRERTRQEALADRTGASWRGRSVGGDVGALADGRRQAGSGMARNRAKARLNWVSQGQRCGRCRVRRCAERVSRPARAKTRRLRVLVVMICSPRPMRAVSGPGCGPSPGRPAKRRWRRSAPRGYGSARRRT